MGSVKPFDVIVAGELFVDLIMSGFDFWPQPGREAFASEFHREIGGGRSLAFCRCRAGNNKRVETLDRLRENQIRSKRAIRLSTGRTRVMNRDESQ